MSRHVKSPRDWRTQFIYFLLPDRFSSDDLDAALPLDRDQVQHNAPADGPLRGWYWNRWAVSGRDRFQGGTLNGVAARLDYLQDLGVTTVWLGPVWKQRAADPDRNDLVIPGEDPSTADPFDPPLLADIRRGTIDDFRRSEGPRDAYHGYAIQHFEQVDPRFGTKADLKRLVADAHYRGMYVIFDILINHSAVNFDYDVAPPTSTVRPPFPPPAVNGHTRYKFGGWYDIDNRRMPPDRPITLDDAVWPKRLRHRRLYDRMGEGSYAIGDLESPSAEFRISDYRNRDFRYPYTPADSPMLDAMVDIWSRWIEVTDCDGFRVDTFKHVPVWVAAEFARRIKEFAAGIGKDNFLVLAEIGGGDEQEETYLLGLPDIHVLELGERRAALRSLAAGEGDLGAQAVTFLEPPPEAVERLVTTIDDHDGLGLDPQWRMAAAHGDHTVLSAAALMLFGPAVPCLYYGTEQALCGPVGQGGYLAGYGYQPAGNAEWVRPHGGDRYLREAMFGPIHPRKAGAAGRPGPGVTEQDTLDRDMPGFGPMGTTGQHVFDPDSPWYKGISLLAGVRRRKPVLGTGAITRITTGRIDGGRLGVELPDTLVAWVRFDPSKGRWALIVIDVTPPGGPAYRPALDVELPGLPGAASDLQWQLALTRENLAPSPTPPAVPGGLVVVLPQSGVATVALGRVQPGEIRVYAT